MQETMLTKAIPADRPSRWALASELIARWFGDAPQSIDLGSARVDIATTERRLGFALPASLREWYLHSGSRYDVWNVQDHLVPLSELCVEEDRLVFFRENQGVVHWSIPISTLSLPDPPVTVSDPSGVGLHHGEAPSISEFALQMLCLSAKFSALDLPRANGQVTDNAILAFGQHLPRLPFSDLHWPPFPTRLYGNESLLVEIDSLTWVWVTAIDAEAFALAARLAEEAGVEWESVHQFHGAAP